jgi:hypothetical protein
MDTPPDVREHPAFRAVTTQLTELRAQVAAAKQKELEQAKLAEEAKLKAQGDYETLSKKMAAERDAERAQLEAERRSLKLQAALAGITDDLARDGAIARCAPDADIDKYVFELKSSRPDLWQSTTFAPSRVPPQGARAQSQSGTDWEKIKQNLNHGNPKEVAAGITQVLEYQKANSGKLPPGF